MSDAIERLQLEGSESAVEWIRGKVSSQYGYEPEFRDVRAMLDAYDALRTIAAQLADALDLAEWLKYGHDAEIPYCIGCDMCVDESHSRCDHGIHKGWCKVAAALEAWEKYDSIR